MSTSRVSTVHPQTGSQHPKIAAHSSLPSGCSSPELAFTNPQVKEAIRHSIGIFKENAMNMMKEFERIKEILEEIDKEQPQLELVKAWKALEQQYRQRLWSSRDLAEEVSSNSEQFEFTTLPLVAREKDQTQDIIEVVKDCMSQSERAVWHSEADIQMMQGHHLELIVFLRSLEIRSQDTEGDVIKELRERVKDLSEQKRKVEQEVLGLCEEIGFYHIFKSVIPTIPDVIWPSVRATGASSTILERMVPLEHEVKELQKALKAAREELRDAEAQDAETNLAKACMKIRRFEENFVIRFAQTFQTLGAFPEAIRRDCEEIIRCLQERERLQPPVIVEAYRRDQNTIYECIGQALQGYARGIALENIGVEPRIEPDTLQRG